MTDVTDTGSPEERSPALSDGSPHSAPEASRAAADHAGDVVAVRKGMFGAVEGGDTSGYGGLVAPVREPGPSPRPYGEWYDAAVEKLDAALGAVGSTFDRAVELVNTDNGELTLRVRREELVATMQALRDDADLRFELCLGVSGVHFPDATDRELRAVYHLLSITHNRRVRVEVVAPDADPHVPSCVSVYPTLDWHERETWDFFGIVFDGHPSLTRIQMPDDWPGHPQRKDYPLGGIPVEYKGAEVPPPDQRRAYS